MGWNADAAVQYLYVQRASNALDLYREDASCGKGSVLFTASYAAQGAWSDVDPSLGHILILTWGWCDR